jgi:hypothetical protein
MGALPSALPTVNVRARHGVPLRLDGVGHAARPAVVGPPKVIRPRPCRDQQRWSKAERCSALHTAVAPAAQEFHKAHVPQYL